MPAIILTPALGRWSVLLLTAALPYARPSASPAEGMGKHPLIWGTVLIAAALIAATSSRAWIAAAVVVAVTACFGSYCRHRIAGITGDTLGANVQLCESAALLTFLWTGYPAMTRVWLIRHGEPAEEARNRCYGSLDIGLSENGRRQMEGVAQHLKAEPDSCHLHQPEFRARWKVRA